MKPYYVVLPKSFDIHELVAKDNERYEKVNPNVVKGILGEITKRISFKLAMEEIEEYDPKKCCVNMSSIRFKAIFGNEYKLVLELLHNDILYKYPYSEGKCFSFALNPKIVREGFELYAIKSDDLKSKNIITNLKKDSEHIDNKLKKRFNFLIKFFDPNRLSIELEEAKLELENEQKYVDNPVKQLINSVKVADLANGIYNFSYNPETDGRFHNNFVRFSKELRKHLRYDGKKMVEIDLKNSIPFIFSCLFTNSINLNVQYLSKSSYNLYHNRLLPYMFPKTLESTENTDVLLFHEMCSDGRIYEAMVDDYIIEYELDYVDKNNIEHYKPIRGKVKRDMLAMFFAKNSYYEKMQKVFSKHFPNVLNMMRHFKMWKSKRLSHLLFQIEAYVMLEIIARGFNKENNGKIPIFTIHDCIVTTEDHIDRLIMYIDQKLQEIFTLNIPKKELKSW